MALSDSDSPGPSAAASRAASSHRGRAGGPAHRRPSPSPEPFRPRRAASPSGRSPDFRAPPILPSETSSLLHHLNDGHGTFTPPSGPSTGTDLPSASEGEGDDREEPQAAKRPSWRAKLSRRIKSKKVRTSRALAREAGVEYNKMM